MPRAGRSHTAAGEEGTLVLAETRGTLVVAAQR